MLGLGSVGKQISKEEGDKSLTPSSTNVRQIKTGEPEHTNVDCLFAVRNFRSYQLSLRTGNNTEVDFLRSSRPLCMCDDYYFHGYFVE